MNRIRNQIRFVRVSPRKVEEEDAIYIEMMANAASLTLTKAQAMSLHAQLGIFLGEESRGESPETDGPAEESQIQDHTHQVPKGWDSV